jgi:hypothetical protein
MRRAFVLLLGLLAVGAVVVQSTAAHSSDGGSSGRDVLEFDVMTPVVAPFTGATHAIRGVPGGGVPWQIDRGRGELRSDGRLEIRVKGLVLVATGQNPVDHFRGVVNCLTTGSPDVGVNLATAPVPASPDGDARIRAKVELPDPCVAPIVFVTSGNGAAPGAWFAATGR